MPLVYRVENKYGEGCYQEGAMFVNDLEHHTYTDKHTSPSEDEGINRQPNNEEKCGFLNMEQVKAWFTRAELKRMARNGYDLIEKEVREITAIGENQVLFLT